MMSFFPESYDQSRLRFIQDSACVRDRWPRSRLEKYSLEKFNDLSMDWLWLEPHRKDFLVMITMAEHGIEGYAGSAMLKLFMEEYLPRFNPENTGVLLVHAINPWGMKYHLRNNPNNVDLNRNFIHNGIFHTEHNRYYDLFANFLNPSRRVGHLNLEAIQFYANVARYMVYPGRKLLQAATLLGQSRHSKGVYFGGVEHQEETKVLMNLYRSALSQYQNFIQLDMHTGYGPRYQMSFLVPSRDSISSAEASKKFNYPLVQKVDADEFYAIHGDMGEYVYELRDAEFPRTNVFAGGFEFGTYGDSLPGLVRSLQTTILENQLRHHGAISDRVQDQIRALYEELFIPAEAGWREKALADCRQAYDGVFRSFGIA